MNNPVVASTSTVLCAWCRAAYLPTPDQELALTTIPYLVEWARRATRYAVETAGWHQRPDGQLLCTAHPGSEHRRDA